MPDGAKPFNPPKETAMPKFVIEREMPGAGKLSQAELQAAARKSCDVLEQMGPKIQWLHSYVTDDKLYCVYMSQDESLIREHARQGGFPVDRISRVRSMLEPATAEMA